MTHNLTSVVRAGFILAALVSLSVVHAADPAEPEPPRRESPAIEAFRLDMERLNARRESRGASAWFTRVEELGRGVAQLIVEDTWAGAPLADRQSSLQIMFNLWSIRSGIDEGVQLLITDQRGIPLMQGSR